MPKLRNCPFCGEQPQTKVQVVQAGSDKDVIWFGIECKKCGVYQGARLNIIEIAHFDDVQEAEEKAIAAWNRRDDHS